MQVERTELLALNELADESRKQILICFSSLFKVCKTIVHLVPIIVLVADG